VGRVKALRALRNMKNFRKSEANLTSTAVTGSRHVEYGFGYRTIACTQLLMMDLSVGTKVIM
jgi:hypothetical protein